MDCRVKPGNDSLCRPGEGRDPYRGMYRSGGLVDDLRNNEGLGLMVWTAPYGISVPE